MQYSQRHCHLAEAFTGGAPTYGPICKTQVPKAGKEEGDKIRKLQIELAALKRQNALKEDETHKNLSSMKQELEKSKQQYESRLQELQILQGEAKPAFAHDQAAQNRVKELENQVLSTL